ncbi:cysteine desulfurase family protein [Dyadobacter frigoris]|uniref:cysteine desulfurase n=1 Tax=Dyadobacter frigoris TaxID=2576211 RepID=A0A4U6CU34_9BACT|nr:IscS subfamily cysteine desulfurase [Dyadobacter frigoris]TKT88189.1 aminotransferase class V-fold PLP-dependent enzyme [Dyadobacter frigoris]GLU53809.1 cysteine desulfurase IscS [Dyadobacter frigoris]
MKLPVYLDNAATTPMDPKVLEEMLPYFLENFGNAASNSHVYGWTASEAVDIAREQVAELIGAHPSEIVFTSGATESINLAIKGVFENYKEKGNHIITCVTEHRAVLDTCEWVENTGGKVTYLPVNPEGVIELTELENAITSQTILISIMFANNETGTIQPVEEISKLARKHGILFFSDATQAVGKILIDVNEDGMDMLSLSAHKLYGPKGIGALYVRRRNPKVNISSQIHGGGHEKNMRSGTLNVPGIVGLGKACEICKMELESEPGAVAVLRNLLERELLKMEGTKKNGSMENRLPNITNISFEHVNGEALLLEICSEIAVSRGSACSSVTTKPSHVLKALGLSDTLALSSFRMSLGRFTTLSQIEYAVQTIRTIVENHRSNMH